MGKLQNVPAWDVKRVRPKSDVIRQAKKDGKTVHFAKLSAKNTCLKKKANNTSPGILWVADMLEDLHKFMTSWPLHVQNAERIDQLACDATLAIGMPL